MYYDKLKNYRRIIAKSRKHSIFLLVIWLFGFFALLCGIILNASAEAVYAVSALPLLLLLVLQTANWIREDTRLLNEFSSIEKNNALNKTYQLTLHSPKVILLEVPEVKARVSLPSAREYYGLRIVSDDKTKYYYFFEGNLRYKRLSMEMILERFVGDIQIQCYENTTIVKKIENDPYFVRIRYGEYCE